MSRSVRRCWINISSTWAVESSGLSDARQTVMKTAKASRNLRFFSWASRMCSLRDWARSGMRLLNFFQDALGEIFRRGRSSLHHVLHACESKLGALALRLDHAARDYSNCPFCSHPDDAGVGGRK